VYPSDGFVADADVTVVIPTFNEERFIARQLKELRRCTSAMPVRIIVADNNSSDRTVELARSSGADDVTSATGTVAAVRNAGAELGQGSVLIFMDADVFPTEQWARRVPAVVASIVADPLLVTGSWVAVPANMTWIEKYWFKPLERHSNNHINSGHLIVSRELFVRLKGFDEHLRTGEDFDFSVRARSLGARIVDDPTLKVIHEGYPKNLGEFVRREIWHGAGDCRNVRTLFSSKVAIVGLAVFHLLLVALLLAIYFRSLRWLLAGVGFSFVVGGLASFIRYRRADFRTRLINAFLYSAYFTARGFSLYAARLRFRGGDGGGTSRH
jgi:glycosyltransferase involved in cell wall biosynthesis